MKKVLVIALLILSLSALSQPNIIIIYLDDAPNGLTHSTGGPDFVQTPNIDRLYDSSMNFKNNYVAISLCAPSRAVLMTGNYPCNTGVTDNNTQSNLNMSLPTFGHQLKQAGYYTAAIGKYHGIIGVNGSYDWSYRLESVSSQGDKNIKWSRNGKDPKKAGQDTLITKVIIDTAVAIIQRIQQPKFILLSLRCPHTPTEVPPPYDHVYDNNALQWGADTAKYTSDYPSFLYGLPGKNYKTTAKITPLVKEQHKSIAYLDERIGYLLNSIDPNTMVIFTSDNGFLNDNHGLYGKRWPYKQSVEVPLSIWYNQWFAPGESELFTSSVDLYATILHAAGLTHDGSQGYSIKDLYDSVVARPFAYYSMPYTAEENNEGMAFSRAVWDQNYKLISFGCNEMAEQFFDLQADPLETINIINEPSQHTNIQFYRTKLVELSETYGDTIPGVILNCNLIEN